MVKLTERDGRPIALNSDHVEREVINLENSRQLVTFHQTNRFLCVY